MRVDYASGTKPDSWKLEKITLAQFSINYTGASKLPKNVTINNKQIGIIVNEKSGVEIKIMSTSDEPLQKIIKRPAIVLKLIIWLKIQKIIFLMMLRACPIFNQHLEKKLLI